MSVSDVQYAICAQHGVQPLSVHPQEKVGISLNVRDGLQPINGLRHAPVPGTTGWFIWAGMHMEEGADFFKPLHVEHLDQWAPKIVKFLSLPPGWRFLVADDYEDVWFDASLLGDTPA
jgi:hypothetical protein